MNSDQNPLEPQETSTESSQPSVYDDGGFRTEPIIRQQASESTSERQAPPQGVHNDASVLQNVSSPERSTDGVTSPFPWISVLLCGFLLIPVTAFLSWGVFNIVGSVDPALGIIIALAVPYAFVWIGLLVALLFSLLLRRRHVAYSFWLLAGAVVGAAGVHTLLQSAWSFMFVVGNSTGGGFYADTYALAPFIGATVASVLFVGIIALLFLKLKSRAAAVILCVLLIASPWVAAPLVKNASLDVMQERYGIQLR